jgi:hypothetical protein
MVKKVEEYVHNFDMLLKRVDPVDMFMGRVDDFDMLILQVDEKDILKGHVDRVDKLNYLICLKENLIEMPHKS